MSIGVTLFIFYCENKSKVPKHKDKVTCYFIYWLTFYDLLHLFLHMYFTLLIPGLFGQSELSIAFILIPTILHMYNDLQLVRIIVSNAQMHLTDLLLISGCYKNTLYTLIYFLFYEKLLIFHYISFKCFLETRFFINLQNIQQPKS